MTLTQSHIDIRYLVHTSQTHGWLKTSPLHQPPTKFITIIHLSQIEDLVRNPSPLVLIFILGVLSLESIFILVPECSVLPCQEKGFLQGTSVGLQAAAAAAAKSLQSCPTLCNPIDNSPLGSSVAGILQARILEWVAISFSKGYSRDRQLSGTQGMAGSQMCKFRKLHMRLAHYCQE